MDNKRAGLKESGNWKEPHCVGAVFGQISWFCFLWLVIRKSALVLGGCVFFVIVLLKWAN